MCIPSFIQMQIGGHHSTHRKQRDWDFVSMICPYMGLKLVFALRHDRSSHPHGLVVIKRIWDSATYATCRVHSSALFKCKRGSIMLAIVSSCSILSKSRHFKILFSTQSLNPYKTNCSISTAKSLCPYWFCKTVIALQVA